MKQITVFINEERYKSNINETNVDKYCKMPGMTDEVKSWYHAKYKDDPIWKDIEDELTFCCVLHILLEDNKSFDGKFGDDSIVRERIFWHIVELCGVRYDDLYNLWIK